MDHSLCLLIYKNTEHVNVAGKNYHEIMVNGFRYALGVGLLEELNQEIVQMRSYGLSPAQIVQHTKEVRELAVSNGLVMRNIFLLLLDVMKICPRRVEELWEKHPSNPVSVHLWIDEHPDNVVYYQ